jgi:uncharacterized BrkB/YihY/UPF0761 family membrane protein
VSKTVSIVLLVLFVCAAAVAAFMGFFLVFASDSCGSGNVCSSGQIALGVAIATVGQVLVVVAGLWWTIHRLRRDRPAWWVPLLGVVAVAAVLLLGAWVAFEGANID